MERWIAFVIASICVSFFLKCLINTLATSSTRSSATKKKHLPPGPSTLGFLAGVLFPPKFSSGLEKVILDLKSKYGPIFGLRIGPIRAIFISSHSAAHEALIQKGAIFSERPKAVETVKFMKKESQDLISLAPYGSTWRLLRRNLTSGVLNPTQAMSFSGARDWVLQTLIDRLLDESSSSRRIGVLSHFQYATFSLSVFMCLGKRLEDEKIRDVQTAVNQVMLIASRSTALNVFPRLSKILFPDRYEELARGNQNQEDLLVPLIKSRIEHVRQRGKNKNEDPTAYVDTLMDLELPDQKRNLSYKEMASLCVEFLLAGTDTTSITLEWIMANLVKNPNIQLKLYQEIKQVVSPVTGRVKEEDLQHMPYLKAVVLEGLRRHPPTHFGIPHAVTQEVELEGYTIPTNAMVIFMLAELGMDPKVWEEPMEFKPERFLTTTNVAGGDAATVSFDLTGTTEIKMMPFGAGRRMCPAYGMAIQNLEFLLANLVMCFEWSIPANQKIDLSENQNLHTGMKTPLKVNLFPRQ